MGALRGFWLLLVGTWGRLKCKTAVKCQKGEEYAVGNLLGSGKFLDFAASVSPSVNGGCREAQGRHAQEVPSSGQAHGGPITAFPRLEGPLALDPGAQLPLRPGGPSGGPPPLTSHS